MRSSSTNRSPRLSGFNARRAVRCSSATCCSSRATRSSSLESRFGGAARPGAAAGVVVPAPAAAEQLLVALLLLPGPARQARDELRARPGASSASWTSSSAAKRCSRSLRCFSSPGVCGPRSMSTASSEISADVEPSASSSRCRYFAARLPGPLARRVQPRRAEPVERLADRRLVVVDDRVAVRRLVAGEPQRVQRERVASGVVRCFSIRQPSDADLDGIGVHVCTPSAHGWLSGKAASEAVLQGSSRSASLACMLAAAGSGWFERIRSSGRRRLRPGGAGGSVRLEKSSPARAGLGEVEVHVCVRPPRAQRRGGRRRPARYDRHQLRRRARPTANMHVLRVEGGRAAPCSGRARGRRAPPRWRISDEQPVWRAARRRRARSMQLGVDARRAARRRPTPGTGCSGSMCSWLSAVDRDRRRTCRSPGRARGAARAARSASASPPA